MSCIFHDKYFISCSLALLCFEVSFYFTQCVALTFGRSAVRVFLPLKWGHTERLEAWIIQEVTYRVSALANKYESLSYLDKVLETTLCV